MTISEAERRAGIREERWFLMRLMLIFALVAAGILFVAVLRSRTTFSQFPRVKLSDGTWLVARAVTVGTSHPFEIRFSIEDRLRGGNSNYQDRPTTQTNRMLIWLTHENDGGELLDLDWFSRCELFYSDDFKVPPRNYQRKKQEGNRANRMVTGFHNAGANATGFQDAKPFTGKSRTMIVSVISCDFPLVRPQEGTMRLDIYDGTNKSIVQLDVPYPRLPAPLTSDWQPEQLPATKSDGDLDVTLTGVQYRKQRHGLVVTPQLTFVHDRQESKTWGASTETSDQLGNVSQAWNCDLSPAESAWKMRLSLTQNPQGKFLPEETKKLPSVALAAAKALNPFLETHVVNGIQLTLIGLGGPGPVESMIPNSQDSFKTGSYQRGASGFSMSSTFEGNKHQFEFGLGYPFVIIGGDLGGTEGNIQLVFRDQTGAILKEIYRGGAGGATFWFFDPLPTSTAVEIEIFAQRKRHVEFLIAPPSPRDIQVEKQ